MCMAPRVPETPAPRNLLRAYGRTLDLDKEADRLDYRNLQRLEAGGRIDRAGRELPAAPAESAPPAPRAAPEPGPEEPRPVGRGETEAKRRSASQARAAGRAPEVAAGSRLGRGNSAKRTLLGA